jgi:hypothetical protein
MERRRGSRELPLTQHLRAMVVLVVLVVARGRWKFGT